MSSVENKSISSPQGLTLSSESRLKANDEATLAKRDKEKDIKASGEKKTSHSSKHDDCSSKSSSNRDKHREDKKSEKYRKDDRHHHHRTRKHSDDRHSKKHTQSRRSASSSSSSSSSRSYLDRKHSTRRSKSRSNRRSRSRDHNRYRKSNDYESRTKNDYEDRKNNDYESAKSKHEAKKPSTVEKTLEPDETNPSANIVEMLKQIEVPKELRYNQKEAAKFQMEQLRKKTEEMTGIKVPSFYSTTAINPLAYAEQQRKRKLLWSKAKDNEKETTTGIVGRAIVESQDEKTAEKFKKLMGIKSNTNESKNDQSAAAAVNQIQKMQQQAFEAMDKEYNFARMTTHTHRGMGLGFATNATTVIDPNQIQRAAQLNK